MIVHLYRFHGEIFNLVQRVYGCSSSGCEDTYAYEERQNRIKTELKLATCGCWRERRKGCPIPLQGYGMIGKKHETERRDGYTTVPIRDGYGREWDREGAW